VLSTGDPWSCGWRERRSERGTLHCRPEGAFYRVPHTFTCLLLGVSVSWFYKWRDPKPNARQQRRTRIDAAVKAAFGAARGLPGSPRLQADLVEAGWKVSEKTVADSMRRLGLVARIRKRTKGNDQARQVRGEVPGRGQEGPHRNRAEVQVVRRHHRDPHRAGSCIWLP
jgi:hypothetical protein